MFARARRIGTALCMGLLVSGALAQPAGAKPKVVLVELFTSEGCSDCPPADELLRSVDQQKDVAGDLVVGISEHVTYWNSLGWRDPFSAGVYDERQAMYARRFGLDSVYTPQMVVNGEAQFVGSDRARLANSLHKAIQQPATVDVRIASAVMMPGTVEVRFRATGELAASKVEFLAVLVDDEDRSSVQRGENSGKTLTHVSVARALERVSDVKAGTVSQVQLALPSGFQPSMGHQVILFAQAVDSGRVLSVDVAKLAQGQSQ